MSEERLGQYWENLLKKKPNWIDYIGGISIGLGVIYIAACFIYPAVKDVMVPVIFHEFLITVPLSVGLITLGIISIAHNTQRKIVIPIINTLLEAYTSLGLLCTSIGARAHFRIKKMGLILAILTVSFTIFQVWAEAHAKRLQSDDTLRRLLISYIDRHNLTISSRPYALDLKDSIASNLPDMKYPQNNLLWASMAMLSRLYVLDQQSEPLTHDGFRKNLEYESVSYLEKGAVDRAVMELADADDERSNLDAIIYLTLAASIEHSISIDGQEPAHVGRALSFAQEALQREDQAEKEAKEGRLPIFYSFRNAYGVAIENFSLSSEGQNIEERVASLEEAYNSFIRSARGPLFCRQRSINNEIDLEMKALLLSPDVRDRLVHGNSALGKEVGVALTNPEAWHTNKLRQLSDLENYLSLPEISLTKLQVTSVFAADLYRKEGANFCASTAFLNLYRLSESALRRSLLLGFNDCSFFRNAEASHIPIFTLCPPPSHQQSLCSTLRAFIAEKDFSECTLCGAQQ